MMIIIEVVNIIVITILVTTTLLIRPCPPWHVFSSARTRDACEPSESSIKHEFQQPRLTTTTTTTTTTNDNDNNDNNGNTNNNHTDNDRHHNS